MPPALVEGKPKKLVFNDDGEAIDSTTNNAQKEKKKKSKKVNEQDGGEVHEDKPDVSIDQFKTKPAEVAKGNPKKIVFNDEGEAMDPTTENAPKKKKKKTKKANEQHEEVVKKEEEPDVEGECGEDDYFAKRDKMRSKGKHNGDEAHKLWFNVFTQYPVTDEVLDMKEKEQMELHNICKSSFQSELTSTFAKRNPTDTRWLQTALQKGTAKDRANAGALLVTSNAIANLDALNTLIGFTKPTNKSCTDVIHILTDLWKEVLLPPHRKLLSIQMRGSDWKLVRKDSTLAKEQQKRIYAYWHFESELKDLYFEFLKNLQLCMQTGQENAKNTSIVASSQLLAFAPEKEQMLLTMLVNKLGDPVPRIASKALHHLTDVAHKHPNMCGVIVKEAEKLLFRNNISDRAQHFALCFLSSIAPAGRPEVCTKLVNICFSLFKMLVQKGAVNNHTMQAILRCLQKAILEAKPADGSTEILNKEMQDTIYRLVHLADIRISVQTLGLLLQLITVNTDKSDRFYNALYKKLFSMELVNIGNKTAAQLLHIVHRAIHIDSNAQRVQAFIKRILQIALYMPPNMAAGCLIVINKLLRSRKAPLSTNGDAAPVATQEIDMSKFDSDGEEKYEDVPDDDVENSNVEAEASDVESEKERDESTETKSLQQKAVKNSEEKEASAGSSGTKMRDTAANKYDPYHRVPAFAGAEFALRTELLLLRQHFHPTVQVFAENILNGKPIDYYGDPLRDFGLPHFLERFAFKNPKKLDNKSEKPIVAQRAYVAYGARGKPVNALTASTCTEDEMYIFNFLEHKRQQAVINKTKKVTDDEETEDGLKPSEVNDDEFEDYLDGFFSKKNQPGTEDDEEELDFLKDLGGELKNDTPDNKAKKTKKKPSKRDVEDDDDDDELDDIDADWGDDDDDDDGNQFEGEDMSDDEMASLDGEDDDDDDGGSISFDEDNANSGSDDSAADDNLSDGNDEDEDESDNDGVPMKRRKASSLDGKNFAKKLKQSTDMKSLFAAADDFADLLEETGKTKGQGTANAVFNKDKSSDKQMKWEEKRHSNAKTYTKRGSNKTRFATGSGKKRKR